MSLFGNFKRKRKAPRGLDDAPRADETAPGLKAIKALWDIESKKPPERIHGEVATDIYATNRSNGVPRRRHPHHVQPRNTDSDDHPY